MTEPQEPIDVERAKRAVKNFLRIDPRESADYYERRMYEIARRWNELQDDYLWVKKQRWWRRWWLWAVLVMDLEEHFRPFDDTPWFHWNEETQRCDIPERPVR